MTLIKTLSGFKRTSAAILNGAGGNGMAKTPRWLRFDFSADNKQTLKVLADTHIRVGSTVIHFDEDTSFDLSETINAETSPNGKDWYVFLDTEKHVTCSLTKAEATGTKRIGQFHTLCVDAGASLTGQIPADPGSLSVNDYVLIKNVEENSDFYDFYNRKVTAVSTNAVYDTITVEHPLKGYTAGDILPEAVWCLTFRPKCSPDGMCYDPDTDIAVDIYLQSGKDRNTRSAYGAYTTRARQQENHQADMNAVGKLLISDEEFTSAALGSNEKTNIAGSAASSVVTAGGHVDTASRRMISFIGGEDFCGTIFQWLRNVSANNGSDWSIYDGVGNFGQTFGTSNALIAGGDWGNGAHCGSRCRSAVARLIAGPGFGARGVSRVVRGI